MYCLLNNKLEISVNRRILVLNLLHMNSRRTVITQNDEVINNTGITVLPQGFCEQGMINNYILHRILSFLVGTKQLQIIFCQVAIN